MKKEFRAVVRGRVQMVMYRDFAARAARREGIVGLVRNLSDGTVEVVAQGEPAALKTYLEKLHRGSLLAKVERVDVWWGESAEVAAGFRILYS